MLATQTAPVKHVRHEFGLTQEQLARILGTTWVTISRWERGISEPPPEAGEKLHRLEVLLKRLDRLIAKADLPMFLLSPNPAMNNFPPSDLLQSGYAFQKLLELVDKTRHGEFS